jgi:hypothetical protein
MNSKPNPADFSVFERPNEYRVTFRVAGEVTRTISADSEADAIRKAAEMADRIAEGEDDAELDEVFDVGRPDVRKTPPMFRVTRNGQAMQVSRLQAGDLPREPDERGF